MSAAGLFTRTGAGDRLLGYATGALRNSWGGRMTVLAREAGRELLERSESLSVLGEALAEVTAHSRGRLVLVRREAGIGKTALVRRFCEAQRPPCRILWGACEALFTPRPLGPLAEVAQSVGGEVEELVDSGARLHELLSALTEEVAKRQPTVLVL